VGKVVGSTERDRSKLHPVRSAVSASIADLMVRRSQRRPLSVVAPAGNGRVASGAVRTMRSWPEVPSVTVSRSCRGRRAGVTGCRRLPRLVSSSSSRRDGSGEGSVPYRHEGHGRAAHHPPMIAALLLCAYPTRLRSSLRDRAGGQSTMLRSAVWRRIGAPITDRSRAFADAGGSARPPVRVRSRSARTPTWLVWGCWRVAGTEVQAKASGVRTSTTTRWRTRSWRTAEPRRAPHDSAAEPRTGR
jgi:hypothetical protein